MRCDWMWCREKDGWHRAGCRNNRALRCEIRVNPNGIWLYREKQQAA